MKVIVGSTVAVVALSLSVAHSQAAPVDTANQQNATPFMRLAQSGHPYGGYPPPACPNGYYWSCRPIYPGAEPYCSCWPSWASWPYIYGPYR